MEWHRQEARSAVLRDRQELARMLDSTPAPEHRTFSSHGRVRSPTEIWLSQADGLVESIRKHVATLWPEAERPDWDQRELEDFLRRAAATISGVRARAHTYA